MKVLFGLAVVAIPFLWLANIESGAGWRIQTMLLGHTPSIIFGNFLNFVIPLVAVVLSLALIFLLDFTFKHGSKARDENHAKAERT